MKDLKKVQEFFSKPIREKLDLSDSEFTDLGLQRYSSDLNNELSYYLHKGETGLKSKINTPQAREAFEADLRYAEMLKKDIADVKVELDRRMKSKKGTNESKQETGVGIAKKQLDALGVKYELGNKFKPFKIIYKPTGKPDKFYDTFNNIIDLYNLGNVVKSSMSEAKQEDPTDIIAMDVPLFLRMLEYAREDAKQDIDIHKVTERAIEAVKLRGLLSMDDYQDIIGEPIDEMTGYSQYLATPKNPKGKTQGLTQRIMDRILTEIITMGDNEREETIRLGEGIIEEELCAKGKAYRKRRIAAGEKSSAYLSGRAVKVCKGQMSGTKVKKKKVNEESDARKSATQSFQKMPIGKVVKTTKGDFKKIEADKFENISTKVKYNSTQMSYTTPATK